MKNVFGCEAWQRLMVSGTRGLPSCVSSSRSMSFASTDGLEKLVARATKRDVCPARRNQHILHSFSDCQPTEAAPNVHVTAVVHPNAKLGSNVLVGPYSVIGRDVVLEPNVHLQSHVVINGKTRVGNGTQVHSFASLGDEPQDKKHKMVAENKEREWTLIVGSNCVIREHVTVHGSTSYSQSPTFIGDDCWLLCGAHVAHDSQVGRRVVVSNNVCIGGHVSIGDGAIVGGQVGIKQHVSVGPLAMLGGQSAVDGDVIPCGLVLGNRAKLVGLNLIGLRRTRMSRSNIKLLLQVYRYLFGSCDSKKTGFAPPLELVYRKTVVERAIEAKQFLAVEELDANEASMVHEMIDFVIASPQRFRSYLCPAVIATSSH